MTDQATSQANQPIHPYAPPQEAAPSTPSRRRLPSSSKFFIATLIALVPAMGIALAEPSSTEWKWLLVFSFSLLTLLALLGALRALTDLFLRFRRKALAPLAALGLLALIGVQASLFCFGYLLAWLSAVGFQRGRQLRHNGRVLLPPVARRAWSSTRVESISAELTPTQRATLARRWIENARTEHASVAAFARLTLDLMTLGAPAKLLVDAQKDALDEVRHAELCFALARSFDGNEVGPAPFSEISSASELPSSRVRALSHLAVDSLVDGALLEGMSARVVARLARSVTEPSVRDVLLEIARDEGRHAAHGWDVVLFCLEEGGAPVLDALRGALAGLPADARTTPHEGSDGSLESFGIPGRALESEEYRRTLADLRRRVSALSSSARAAA